MTEFMALSPLLGHCFCDAGIEARALFPSLRSRRHLEHALLAALDDVGRFQRRQVLEPEACSLGLAVAKLPWLNALRKFPVVHDEDLGMPVHDGVLDADALDGGVPEGGEQVRALAQFALHVFGGLARRRFREPANATVAKACAGRMRDHQQIPAVVEDVAGVAPDMPVVGANPAAAFSAVTIS